MGPVPHSQDHLRYIKINKDFEQTDTSNAGFGESVLIYS